MFFDTESGRQTASLDAEPSALADVVFSGEDTALYAGEGALRAYDLAAQRELWAGKAATGISLSADGSTAAAVYQDETIATVYDARTGEVLRTVDFGGKAGAFALTASRNAPFFCNRRRAALCGLKILLPFRKERLPNGKECSIIQHVLRGQLRSRSRAMDAREPCQAGNRAALSGKFHVPRGNRFRGCARRTPFSFRDPGRC